MIELANTSKDVNSYLTKMTKVSTTAKGVFGEQAVVRICEELYQKFGGLLYHSYSYKTVEGLQGNIKKEGDTLYVEKTGSFTEIDVLFVTEYKVFPIEVKAYKASSITLTDKEIFGCSITTKSPVHQNEMHCRHLYPWIFKALPQGKTSYIEPVVVFVDKCTLKDKRSDEQKKYIKAVILNQFKSCIIKLNKPGAYRIDLENMERCLTEACVNVEKKFNLRKVGGRF